MSDRQLVAEERWRRAAGIRSHSVFRTADVNKLVTKALKRVLRRNGGTRSAVSRNGDVVIEVEFNRAIGRDGERMLRATIRSNGRVIATPISGFSLPPISGSAGAAPVVGVGLSAVADLLDEIEHHTGEDGSPGGFEQGLGAALTAVVDFLLTDSSAGSWQEDVGPALAPLATGTAIDTAESQLQRSLAPSEREAITAEVEGALSNLSLSDLMASELGGRNPTDDDLDFDPDIDGSWGDLHFESTQSSQSPGLSSGPPGSWMEPGPSPQPAGPSSSGPPGSWADPPAPSSDPAPALVSGQGTDPPRSNPPTGPASDAGMGDDGHNYTPEDANLSDPLGHEARIEPSGIDPDLDGLDD
jgi:hypothetical protein